MSTWQRSGCLLRLRSGVSSLRNSLLLHIFVPLLFKGYMKPRGHFEHIAVILIVWDIIAGYTAKPLFVWHKHRGKEHTRPSQCNSVLPWCFSWSFLTLSLTVFLTLSLEPKGSMMTTDGSHPALELQAWAHAQSFKGSRYMMICRPSPLLSICWHSSSWSLMACKAKLSELCTFW